MRGRWALLVGLALRARCAAAGDLAPVDEAPPAGTQAAAWPGFAIARTSELVALAWPVAGARAAAGSPVSPTGNPDTACGATPIASRALATSTARARDGLIASVRAAECRHRLPAGLLDSVVLAESAYRPRALSRAGAVGLTQLMRGTAHEVGVPDRRDTAQSIEGGARYLRRMIDRFGEVPLALAAYNAGPGAVTRAGGVPDNGETPGYVARVVGLWQAVAVDPVLPMLEAHRGLPVMAQNDDRVDARSSLLPAHISVRRWAWLNARSDETGRTFVETDARSPIGDAQQLRRLNLGDRPP